MDVGCNPFMTYTLNQYAYITIKISTHLYYLKNKRMTKTFNDFLNVIRKYPKVQNKINKKLERYNRLPYNYQSKIGCDTLIQNVILRELINIMVVTITDLDIE